MDAQARAGEVTVALCVAAVCKPMEYLREMTARHVPANILTGTRSFVYMSVSS